VTAVVLAKAGLWSDQAGRPIEGHSLAVLLLRLPTEWMHTALSHRVCGLCDTPLGVPWSVPHDWVGD
jgi:hypothetical protein